MTGRGVLCVELASMCMRDIVDGVSQLCDANMRRECRTQEMVHEKLTEQPSAGDGCR